MIKGVDAQMMTHRAVEYTKDVSALLRRDELANEFAGKMNRLATEQETKMVTKTEEANHAKIKEREREREGDLPDKKKKKQKQAAMYTRNRPNATTVPSVGVAEHRPLLDIEV